MSQTSQPTVSTGKSWASLITSSSVTSPATRGTRADLGLPMIRLDTSQASQEAITLLQNPNQLQRNIGNHFGLRGESETVRVEGVKTAPRNIVKAFMERDQDVKLLRERSEWLQDLPGVKLQGEQWYPIKLDEVRKTDVFDESGKEKSDFPRKHSQR